MTTTATKAAPKAAKTVAVEVIWHNHLGDIEAHKAGCADVAREMKRSSDYGPDDKAETFAVTSYHELVEKMAASNVGSLKAAYAELGSFEALWHPECKPCLRKLLPQGAPSKDSIAAAIAVAAIPTAAPPAKATVPTHLPYDPKAKNTIKVQCRVCGKAIFRADAAPTHSCFKCLTAAKKSTKAATAIVAAASAVSAAADATEPAPAKARKGKAATAPIKVDADAANANWLKEQA